MKKFQFYTACGKNFLDGYNWHTIGHFYNYEDAVKAAEGKDTSFDGKPKNGMIRKDEYLVFDSFEEYKNHKANKIELVNNITNISFYTSLGKDNNNWYTIASFSNFKDALTSARGKDTSFKERTKDGIIRADEYIVYSSYEDYKKNSNIPCESNQVAFSAEQNDDENGFGL